MHRVLPKLPLLLLAGVFFAGCATSRLTHVWSAADAKDTPVDRILVVALANTETVRRSFEESLVRQLRERGIDAQPSYDEIDDKEELSKENVRSLVEKKGFDGVFISRLLGAKTEVDWVPGGGRMWGYGYDLWGYYDWAWGSPYARGRLEATEVVQWETRLYRASPQQKLIWSTISRTADPRSVRGQVDSVAEAVAERSAKDLPLGKGKGGAPGPKKKGEGEPLPLPSPEEAPLPKASTSELENPAPALPEKAPAPPAKSK